jgi:hypothetical protein
MQKAKSRITDPSGQKLTGIEESGNGKNADFEVGADVGPGGEAEADYS